MFVGSCCLRYLWDNETQSRKSSWSTWLKFLKVYHTKTLHNMLQSNPPGLHAWMYVIDQRSVLSDDAMSRRSQTWARWLRVVLPEPSVMVTPLSLWICECSLRLTFFLHKMKDPSNTTITIRIHPPQIWCQNRVLCLHPLLSYQQHSTQ